MAFVLIDSISATIGTTGTTATINSTGADFFVAVEGCFQAGHGTLTDSRSLTWAKLTHQQNESGAVIWYAANANGGTNHDFTITGGSFATLTVAAFSGSKLTSPFDVENGANNASGTTSQTGSVTPSEDNELLIMGLGLFQSSPSASIDIGTIIQEVAAGGNYSAVMAYQIQTTATARNPTWTHTNYANANVIATFKAAASVERRFLLARP